MMGFMLCMQFEKTDKKPAVIGWTAAAVGAFFLAEWFIHLPLLDFVRPLLPRMLLTAQLTASLMVDSAAQCIGCPSLHMQDSEH